MRMVPPSRRSAAGRAVSCAHAQTEGNTGPTGRLRRCSPVIAAVARLVRMQRLPDRDPGSLGAPSADAGGLGAGLHHSRQTSTRRRGSPKRSIPPRSAPSVDGCGVRRGARADVSPVAQRPVRACRDPCLGVRIAAGAGAFLDWVRVQRLDGADRRGRAVADGPRPAASSSSDTTVTGCCHEGNADLPGGVAAWPHRVDDPREWAQDPDGAGARAGAIDRTGGLRWNWTGSRRSRPGSITPRARPGAPTARLYAGGEAGQIYAIALDGSVEQIGDTGGFLFGVTVDGDGARVRVRHGPRRDRASRRRRGHHLLERYRRSIRCGCRTSRRSTRRARSTSPTPATGARTTGCCSACRPTERPRCGRTRFRRSRTAAA